MKIMAILAFTAKVLENKKLTHDVILLSLTAPEEFSFQAGQYVILRIENGAEYRMKSYSILNPPSEKGKLDLCIKLVEGGFASEVLRKAKKGDSFQIKGPLGFFVFDEKYGGKELWFIGGGTGVAPLYSMIKEHLPHHRNTKFVLIFSVKEKKDLFLHQEFQQLEEKYSNFAYVPTLTRDTWDGATGRVQEHLPADVKDKTFYICGLKELVLETREHLMKKGVKAEHVKFERYS